MGEVVMLNENSRACVSQTSLQVSCYPRDDGLNLFAVEILYPNGKWDIIHHTGDRAIAWKMAGKEAGERKLQLLPDSIWPGRSSLP